MSIRVTKSRIRTLLSHWVSCYNNMVWDCQELGVWADSWASNTALNQSKSIIISPRQRYNRAIQKAKYRNRQKSQNTRIFQHMNKGLATMHRRLTIMLHEEVCKRASFYAVLNKFVNAVHVCHNQHACFWEMQSAKHERARCSNR